MHVIDLLNSSFEILLSQHDSPGMLRHKLSRHTAQIESVSGHHGGHNSLQAHGARCIGPLAHSGSTRSTGHQVTTGQEQCRARHLHAQDALVCSGEGGPLQTMSISMTLLGGTGSCGRRLSQPAYLHCSTLELFWGQIRHDWAGSTAEAVRRACAHVLMLRSS